MGPGMVEKLRSRDWSALVGAVEAGVAAGVAWWVAGLILGVDRPLYAPVAAVVVVGAGYSRRITRVGAMLGGMAIAVAVSEIGVRLVGSGPLQISALTAAAILVARMVADEQLTVLYAGLNAAILVAIGGDGWVPDRVVEGLIGAGSAYVLVYLLLPPRPDAWVKRAMRDQVDTARDNLEWASRALRAASSDHGRRAERRSERIDRNVERLDDSIDFSREVSRLSPWRRRRIGETEELIERASGLQSILRDTTVVVRLASRYAVAHDEPDPHLAGALDAHAGALRSMLAMITGDGDVDAVRTDNDRAREAALAGCDSGGRLHFALVEELVSVADRVAGWAAELSPPGRPAGRRADAPARR